ncbi:MAG TPA: hypothetical protein VIJ86_12580 [Acidimicrobiales bacterium]
MLVDLWDVVPLAGLGHRRILHLKEVDKHRKNRGLDKRWLAARGWRIALGTHTGYHFNLSSITR